MLVTRPRADSEELVGALQARGHDALIEPLLDVQVRDVAVDVSDVQALLITSANGVRAFAALSDARDLRVLTVGQASAEAARKAGFVGVESADGDAEALADLAIARLDPADGPLYHAAGTVTAGALQTRLTAAGFEVRRTPLYEAVPAARLSEATRTALGDGALDAALFFSPRTAKVFVTLLYAEGIAHASAHIRAICLSEAVASALQDAPRQGRASGSDGDAAELPPAASAQELRFADVRVAERPERGALLAALDAAAGDVDGPPGTEAPGTAERETGEPETGEPDDSAVRPARSTTADGPPLSAPGAEPAPSKTAQAGTKDAMTQQDKDDKTPSDPDKPDATAGSEGTDAGEPQDGETADPSNNRALAVIQRFGGIRPMATKLGVAVSTVQGWKNRGAIPESRHDEILAAARSNNIDLDRAVLSASGEESVGSAPAAGSSPWGRPGDAAETVEAEEVPADRDQASDQARDAAPDDAPDVADVAHTDAHAAGAEAEAASAAGPEVAAAPGPAPRKARGWLPGMFLGAAIVVVGAGVAIYARDVWQPYLAGPAQEPDVQPASEQALNDLENTVSELAGQLANVQDRLDSVAQRAQEAARIAQNAADTAQSAAETARQAQSAAQAASDAAAAGAGDGGAAGGQQSAQLRQQVDQLSSRLDQATGRLETLAGRIDAGAAGGGEAGALAQRLETLASRVDELSSRVEQVSQATASRETTQALADRLSALESRIQELAAGQQAASAAAASARPAAQALAVAELRNALRFSSPFAQQLQVVRQMVADDGALAAALDKLQPMADQGVPTRAELSAAFDRAAADAVAANMGASQDGMLGGVLRRLNDVITVRRVDASAQGDSVGARLARAENALAAGDLREAVVIVEQLPDPAKSEMASWLEQARNRIAAEQALSQLSSELMRALSRASDSGTGDASGAGESGGQDGSAN
ncbi:uroporphyrinogen-III synthase [Rhodovibrio sodomensis]|uniref:uroporphyrinogen-III synthase n=1 Tax=Rhodovibrio sodomensis TaxID=1088 RepID=UPI0030845032